MSEIETVKDIDIETGKLENLSLEDAVVPSRDGTAPIKSEYLLPKEEWPTAIVEDQRSEGKTWKKKKGMNKNRRREMKQAETQIRAASVRLCPSVIQPVQCKYGDKCTSEHDIKSFLAQKSEDISNECPLYDARGTCPFSYACRFGSVHMSENGEQLTKEVSKPYEETKNTSTIHIQIALRKRAYDFTPAEEALAALKEERIGSMEKEKRKLDMKSLKGKKYLAPLTTVGNMPFRRICVGLGADITCGEMALATSLLSGAASEYSLVKRHPCEKIFGVQLAGGFPDTMSKAAQILTSEFDVDFIDINMGCPIDIVNDKGGGCALASRNRKMVEVVSTMRQVMKDTPLTVKIRTGLKENVLTAHETITSLVGLGNCAPDLITLHPRSKEQRYTHLARWDFVPACANASGEVPLWACGDILSWENYYERLENYPIEGIMLGRGALIKPWLFTEIDERRTWDITSSERLDIIKKFVDYGLDHWGSDDAGVERTRKFLLEWLSFTCRYIPVGLMEVLPQKMNDRPPYFRGRNEMETLLSSGRAADWVEISNMFLGSPPEGFTFIPKHKASSY